MLQFPCVVFFLFLVPLLLLFHVVFGLIAVIHTACMCACLIRVCVLTYTSIFACVCTWPVRACVCSSIISSTAPLSLPPHCSASLPVLGVWNRSLQEISSLVVQKGKQTARCTNTGRAASLTWAPAGHLSLLCVRHNAETWAASLTARAFFSVFLSPRLSQLVTVSSVCAAAFHAWVLINKKDQKIIHTIHECDDYHKWNLCL